MTKEKKWLTLNAHGKDCLRNFTHSLSALDVWTSKMDYCFNKGLISYSQEYKDSNFRHPIANHCLTNLGIETAAHYFPNYDHWDRTKKLLGL